MNYLSVCSGIEAATVAWHHMGWQPVGFAEIEKFPAQVLAHHYPNVRNYGDLTKHDTWGIEAGSVDLLVGGTPCQAFSVAGLRRGMDDARGQLTLEFVRLAQRLRPRWIVWENVPGVLSSGGGRDFGSFLGALAQLGYGYAYRVLDAQYFGVAQRRRRVFVVGYLGDWRRAAAVLFERESVRGDVASKRAQDAPDVDLCDETLCRFCGVVWTPEGQLECCPICGSMQSWSENTCSTISDGAHRGGGLNGQDATSGRILVDCGLPRRLTPVECERLQGFPDGYTDIRPRGKDTHGAPRYRALGNSMAVPVMRWIGERIDIVDKL